MTTHLEARKVKSFGLDLDLGLSCRGFWRRISEKEQHPVDLLSHFPVAESESLYVEI